MDYGTNFYGIFFFFLDIHKKVIIDGINSKVYGLYLPLVKGANTLLEQIIN